METSDSIIHKVGGGGVKMSATKPAGCGVINSLQSWRAAEGQIPLWHHESTWEGVVHWGYGEL